MTTNIKFVGSPIVIDQDTDLGSMCSPLVKFFGCQTWAYVVWPKEEVKEVRAFWVNNPPTFSYTKDQGIHAWYLPGLDRKTFDTALNAKYSLGKGISFVGKYASRIARFVKYSVILPVDDVKISVNDLWAYQATDGRSLISREFAIKLIAGIDPDVKHLRRALDEIERGDMFELTIAHPTRGLLKGVAEVSERVPAGIDVLASVNEKGVADFKKGVMWDFNGCMCTLVPIHGDDKPYTDIQTIINNLEPVGILPVEMLLDWVKKDAFEYLEGVASGKAFAALGDLSTVDLDDYVRWEQRKAGGEGRAWPLKLAALSGCKTIFPRFIQQLGDQWIEMISGGGKFKVTNRSGAYHLVTPNDNVKKGECQYSHKYGWMVNPDEAVAKSAHNARNLVDATGTADFDDKFEGIVMKAKNGKMYAILIRKPNGPDEKYILEYTGEVLEHWEVPTLKLSNFRIPKVEYGKMTMADPLICGYIPETNEAVRIAEFDDYATLFEAGKRNISLGSTVNWVMLETGATGKAPAFMKLAVSDVTDIAQTGKFSLSKDDVDDYNEWLRAQFKRVISTTKIPPMLLDRIPASLRGYAAVETDPNHPINRLYKGVEEIKIAYMHALSVIVSKIPAPELGTISTHYCAEAAKIIELWGGFWANEALMESNEEKTDLSSFWALAEKVFESVPYNDRDLLVLSLARMVYARGMVERDGVAKWRDGLLFAVKKGGMGMADRLIEAMQSRGLMNDFVFSKEYGLYVQPRAQAFIQPEPKRISLAVNGIMHTMGMTIARQMVEKGEVASDDAVLDKLTKMIKAENKRMKKSILAKIIVADFSFSDGEPRKGIYIASDVAKDGLYRLGVLADEYSFLSNGTYEVSNVYMNHRQLVVVLA